MFGHCSVEATVGTNPSGLALARNVGSDLFTAKVTDGTRRSLADRGQGLYVVRSIGSIVRHVDSVPRRSGGVQDFMPPQKRSQHLQRLFDLKLHVGGVG